MLQESVERPRSPRDMDLPVSDLPVSPFWTESEDWHTAGEPFRIVKDLPTDFLPDALSVADRRTKVLETASHPLDILRQTLCHEPRGHADMYGGFIMPPDDLGAHFGVLFWHKDGFSTACGHGTIALGYWAVSKGLVKASDDGVVDVVIDVPSGRVAAKVAVKNGKPVHADFVNVESFAVTLGTTIHVPSLGKTFQYSIAYGGAYLVSVDASQFELRIELGNTQELVQLARAIRERLRIDREAAQHGSFDIAGVILFEEQEIEAGDPDDIIRQRNVAVIADGLVDRSPCGSGTSARLATLLAEGRIGAGVGKLLHRSIIGSSFEGDIVSEGEMRDGFPTCIPRIRGSANLVGRMKFYIDPQDPLFPGFLLR